MDERVEKPRSVVQQPQVDGFYPPGQMQLTEPLTLLFTVTAIVTQLISN